MTTGKFYFFSRLSLQMLMLVALFGQVKGQEHEWPIVEQSEDWSRAQKNLRTYTFTVDTIYGPLPFELHLPAHATSRALEIEQILKKDAPALIEYFGWKPLGVLHLNLNTQEWQANGFATTFPHNFISLFERPPVGEEHLTSHPYYLQGLVIHELVHILHMDQTRGILKAARSLFGSIGKLGGVTPRWFIEGIATWAESAFTQGGRLTSPLLDYQLRRAYSDPNFCATIDCLDDPGQSPYGHLPYWVGGHFLSFLEEERTGVIACLVRSNSARLPFFLNRAFRFCLDEEAQSAFERFRTTRLLSTNIMKDFKNLRSIHSQADDVLYQKNTLFIQGQLVQVEWMKERAKIGLYGDQGTRHFSFHEKIIALEHPSPFDRSRGELIFSSTRQLKSSPLRWWTLNLETLKASKIVLPENADYVFRLNEGHYIYWTFVQGQWNLRSYRVDETTSRQIIRLEKSQTLRSIRLVKWRGQESVIFATQYLDDKGELHYLLQAQALSPEGGELQTLVHAKDNFELLDAIDEFIILKKDEEFFSLGLEQWVIPRAFARNLVQLRLGDDQKAHFLLKGDHRRSYIAQLSVEKMEAQSNIATKIDVPSPIVWKPSDIQKSLKRYPAFSHLKPHYWTLGIGGTENLTRYDVATSLNDPLGRHFLTMMGSYFQEASKGGGSVGYQYWPSSLGLSFGYDKSYYIRGTRQSVDSQETFSAQLNYRTSFGRFEYRPSIFYLQDNIIDFVSNRNQQQGGLSQGLVYLPLFTRSFIGKTSLVMSHFHQKTEGFKSFRGERYKLSTTLRSGFRPLEFHLSGAFSKLHKKGFRSGLVYGGGSTALYHQGGLHDFYGLAYGDMISNEIRSARGQLDLRLFEHYRGPGFFPLFFKTTHLLLGIDYAKASNIFVDSTFINRNELTSYHGGLSFKVDIGYFIPMSFDLIYAQVQNPSGPKQNQLLFLLRGDLGFNLL